MRALFAALILVLAGMASAEVIQGRAVGVLDGDTIDVLTSTKSTIRVRLAGIDAPEKRQAFGARSKQSLSDLVFSKAVMIEAQKTDRYGRLIGKVMVEGIDAGLAQIERGMAWFYRRYESELSIEDRRYYGEAELEAQTNRRGLWVERDPQPPWDWRHNGAAAGQVQNPKPAYP